MADGYFVKENRVFYRKKCSTNVMWFDLCKSGALRQRIVLVRV